MTTNIQAAQIMAVVVSLKRSDDSSIRILAALKQSVVSQLHSASSLERSGIFVEQWCFT